MERYRLIFDNKSKFIRKIGQGSQATVDYHQLYEKGKGVAVKNYTAIDGTIASEGLKELNSLQRLIGCANIIQLLDVNIVVQHDNIILRLMLPYIKYDLNYYIENTPVSERLNHFDTVMNQLLNVLNNLYYRGIIHCDIKPENILIEVNDDVNVYLADFGLSIQLPCEFSYRHIYKNIEGSPLYKAPELLIQNHYYNEKIDVWSLGLTLLEYIINETITIPTISRADQIIYQIFKHLHRPLTNSKENVKKVIDGTLHDSIDVEKLINEYIPNDKHLLSNNIINTLTSMLQINHADRFSIINVNAKVCPIVIQNLAKGELSSNNILNEYYEMIYKIIYIAERLDLHITTCYCAIDLFSRYGSNFKLLPIIAAGCIILMIKLYEIKYIDYDRICNYYNDIFTENELKYAELLIMKNANYVFTFCDNDDIIGTLKQNDVSYNVLYDTYKLMENDNVYPGEMFTFEIIEYMKK